LKKEIEKFKEGDIVKCINNKGNSDVELHTIYIIKSIVFLHMKEFVNLGNYNYSLKTNGYFIYRFKKVTAEDMTEEEKFNYMKYKLGVKGMSNEKYI